jgi:chromosomal replication initiator protein
VVPLVLHGLPGTGKSHLANILIQKTCAGPAIVTTRMVAAGDLARAATGSNSTEGFADRDLTACDLLIVEDLQLLPPREADAVCELLDQRVARRKATVVTSNVGPAGLRRLPQRQTTRLASGQVVQLRPLSANSRRVLLESAASQRGIRLAPEALDWLAKQGSGGGARAVLGLLNNLASVAAAFPGPLSKAAVIDVLAHAGPPPTAQDVAQIVKRVAAAFGVPEKELLGASRLRRVMIPRQVAMYLARELSGLSLPRLGSAFGRDHSTVLHACRKVEAELDSDVELAGLVRQLRDELV